MSFRKAFNVRSTTTSCSNSCKYLERPSAPNCSLSSLSSISRSSAPSTALAVSVLHKYPVSPSTTMSGTPPVSIATTGMP